MTYRAQPKQNRNPRQHMFDSIADEMAKYMESEPEYFAQALLAGQDAPFGAEGNANITEDQKLRYYERQVFNLKPDGGINYDSPNESGREELIRRVGIPGFTQVMAAVLAKKNEISEPENPNNYDMATESSEAPQAPAQVPPPGGTGV